MSRPAGHPALRLMDWARLRVRLVWAYEDRPVQARYAGRETGECAIWLLKSGQVHIETADHGSTDVFAGHWVFLPPDKCAHQFSPDARIISLRFVAHWPNGEPLFGIERALVIPARAFPELERAARALTRTVHRVFPQLALQVDLLHSESTLLEHLRLELALGR